MGGLSGPVSMLHPGAGQIMGTIGNIAEEPHTIRKKSNGYIPVLSTNHDGYIILRLNSVEFRLHRVLAIQLIPNPENLPEVDHKNRIQSDNRLENLRWVSNSVNQKNKNSQRGIQYEYVDELSDEAIEITDYGDYKKLHLNQNKKQQAYYVMVRDVNDKKTKITVNKFKELYDLI
ncbi:MAG: hypothetical protein EZS28_047016 [Streblomastix strix]|uniref:HNH nuclease domain-containing protein n=1 Tax=Streblomastix strix TaxID=222440 RepID=A0A5J4TGV9_9EUKA|nr:MAG: hypothetical protein EZS28_047016 [Streblomastix strix]